METNYRGTTYVAVQVRLDTYQDTYNRQIYGLMELIGDIGGVQEIIVLAGSVLVGMVAERLLYAEMMKQIYHTQPMHKKPEKVKGKGKFLKRVAKVPAKSNIKQISKQPERNYDPIDEENGTSMSSAAFTEKNFEDRSSRNS